MSKSPSEPVMLFFAAVCFRLDGRGYNGRNVTQAKNTMSQTLSPPPAIAPVPDNHDALPRKRWTVEQCQQMQAAGFLPSRWELIDGEIIDHMPQNLLHVFVLLRIHIWLVSVFGADFVWNQSPLLISPTSQPEPDVWVTTLPHRAFLAQGTLPTPAHVSLVVEVSDTTLRGDLTIKANLYARADIADYWIADIAGRRIVIHRDPTPTGYANVTTHDENALVAPVGQPNHLVRVDDFLP